MEVILPFVNEFSKTKVLCSAIFVNGPCQVKKRLEICAKSPDSDHPVGKLGSVFIHSVVSNDSVGRQ